MFEHFTRLTRTDLIRSAVYVYHMQAIELITWQSIEKPYSPSFTGRNVAIVRERDLLCGAAKRTYLGRRACYNIVPIVDNVFNSLLTCILQILAMSGTAAYSRVSSMAGIENRCHQSLARLNIVCGNLMW